MPVAGLPSFENAGSNPAPAGEFSAPETASAAASREESQPGGDGFGAFFSLLGALLEGESFPAAPPVPVPDETAEAAERSKCGAAAHAGPPLGEAVAPALESPDPRLEKGSPVPPAGALESAAPAPEMGDPEGVAALPRPDSGSRKPAGLAFALRLSRRGAEESCLPQLRARDAIAQGAAEGEKTAPETAELAGDRSDAPRRTGQAGRPTPAPSAEAASILLAPAAGQLQAASVSGGARSDPPARGGPVEPQPAAEQPAAGEPARRFSLEVGVGEAGRRVAVELVERGGRLEVAVRSHDRELAASLRGELGDLVRGLERSGFGARSWAPADTPSEAESGRHERRSQPDWAGADRPKRPNRAEESFAWHLRSLR
ncbi:MAG: hypothetical protein HY822_05335 [Acidobacteria bacterium]|nr:hypothetical protein [Acidobacteriota bacterium]